VVNRVDVAEVHLWGRQIGAVAWDDDRALATFEYHSDFLRSGIELAPLTMPLGPGLFQFPELDFATYTGLPGMLADSLPDKFGHALIDAWLATQGRERSSFSPVEQLCYVGTRGMGALEYHPAAAGRDRSARVYVDELADMAAAILAAREDLAVDLGDDGLAELLLVGTSAGGARAKAILAWNPSTGEIRSGQVEAPEGFEYWILKFDGVGSSDHGLTDPEGYGRIEYAYYLMARDAGLIMTDSRLHEDKAGRAHFMTGRFDRDRTGAKLHAQTLSAIGHLDYNRAGAHAYEDALSVTLQLCGFGGVAQLYRRMVFNVVGRNQDDHTKNIAYVMGRDGTWRLSPAYDVTWAYNPGGEWTSRHQMTIAGKRDDLTRADLRRVASRFGVRDADDVIDAVVAVVGDWKRYATDAGVAGAYIDRISATHRLL
jgi:serine/threonine-protein kinase HipA